VIDVQLEVDHPGFHGLVKVLLAQEVLLALLEHELVGEDPVANARHWGSVTA
jgi:hypothetical protein